MDPTRSKNVPDNVVPRIITTHWLSTEEIHSGITEVILHDKYYHNLNRKSMDGWIIYSEYLKAAKCYYKLCPLEGDKYPFIGLAFALMIIV